jgi:ACS family tartrate transporter-like MFS transporter
MTDDDKVFSKCVRRLVPFMALLYVIAILDRVNVGFAALTMNADLGFTPAVFGFGAGLYFVGVFLFDVPSSVALVYVGARRWIFRIMVTWGLISMGTAFIQGPTSFYILRFLLGVAEAGFYAGVVFYLTCWFPQRYRAQCIAGFSTAVPLANVIGGPLSAYILEMENILGLHGWQWLFLLEGLPACLLGIAVLKLLPDRPSNAVWLDSHERKIIAANLDSEDAADHRNLWPALLDVRVLALCIGLFGNGFARFGIALWLPQIVKAMGFSNRGAGFVVALPYLIAILAMLLWGRSSDRSGERIWHIALPALAAACGLVLAATVQSSVLMIAAFIFVIACIEALIPPLASLVSSFLKGTGAAGALGLISGTGQFGAFFGASIMGVLREGTGSFAPGLFAFALAVTLPAFAVLLLGRRMAPRLSLTHAEPT